jgi:hypothetical protein
VRAARGVPEIVLKAVPERHHERDLGDDDGVDQRGEQGQAAHPPFAPADPAWLDRYLGGRGQVFDYRHGRALLMTCRDLMGPAGRAPMICHRGPAARASRRPAAPGCTGRRRPDSSGAPGSRFPSRRSHRRSAGRPGHRGFRTAGCRRTGCRYRDRVQGRVQRVPGPATGAGGHRDYGGRTADCPEHTGPEPEIAHVRTSATVRRVWLGDRPTRPGFQAAWTGAPRPPYPLGNVTELGQNVRSRHLGVKPPKPNRYLDMLGYYGG